MYLPDADNDPVTLIERALEATVAAEPIQAKIRAAVKEGRIAPNADAEQAGVITSEEARVLVRHRELVARVIAVDDFDRDLGASMLLPALQRQTVQQKHRAAA
jgi:acyl-CoA dehydrogenase